MVYSRVDTIRVDCPESVGFFLTEGLRLGDKTSLEQDIHGIIGIPVSALRGRLLSNFAVDERMAWMEKRETTHQFGRRDLVANATINAISRL
jgi:hypothetical protein